MFTIEQYNSLTAAIAQGALRVKYADKEVEYRSLKEQLGLLKLMKAQLFPSETGTSRTYATFTKDIQQ